MKKMILLSFVLFISIQAFSQDYYTFGKRLIIGTAPSYIWENNKTFGVTYHEVIWNKYVTVNLNKSLYMGLNFRNIFTVGSSTNFEKPRNHYYTAGVHFQYDMIPARKERIYAELSYSYGNYCTCDGIIDPFKRDALQYLGGGFGTDIPISKYISIKGALLLHAIVNEPEDTYGFNFYMLGINFDLSND